MLSNPLCSFWADELSEVWAGTTVEEGKKQKQKPQKQAELFEVPQVQTKGWLASDETMKCIYPITPEMVRRASQVGEHNFDNSGYVIMEDEVTRVRWVKQIY